MNRFINVAFPPIEQADQDGLLMLGGELTVPWMLAAYRQGIFPWPFDDNPRMPTAWWSPDPRAIIPFSQFHISRSLARTMRRGHFAITFNRDFTGVLQGCARRRKTEDGTWLISPLQQAFTELHRMGMAHSVEAWHEDRLVGGVFGLALGGYFSAESMFFLQRDASKVALAHLVDHLQRCGFSLLDIQVLTDHTSTLGAVEIPRKEFLQRLKSALPVQSDFSQVKSR